MATITVNTSDTFEQWRVKTNSIGVTIEDYSNNISTKNVIATGNITASGNIIVTNVISGTSNIGNLTVSGNATLSGNVTSNLVVDGNVSVTRNVVLSSNATVSGNIIVTNVISGTSSIGNLTVSGNATFIGNVITNDSFVGNGTVPAGSLLMWSLASAPAGYLLCDGSAVSRTTYKRLYDVIGTTFGNGNGSSTFNLPDYRNRMPIGAGSTYSVAGTGGSADATLVSHTHTGTTSNPGDFITGSAVTNLQGSGGSVMASASGAFSLSGGEQKAALSYNPGQSLPTTLNITAGSHTHTFTTDPTGSSGTNANLPPYLGIFFIIKT